MLQLLMLAGLLLKGAASQIRGNGNITAVYGEEASCRCELDSPTDVIQVTWQRLSKDESMENLASYSKRFGQHVNVPYRGKVAFTEVSLLSTSITLKNVTWADESCYICAFNVYPDGSKRRQACLTVQGISEVKTDVQVQHAAHEGDGSVVVFSCSATGRPPPAVDWNVPPGATVVDEPTAATVVNADGTFTSSSNVTLRGPGAWSGHADCLLNSGVAGERRERIEFFLNDGHKKNKENEGGGRSRARGIILILIALIILGALVAFVMRRKRSRCHRGAEKC